MSGPDPYTPARGDDGYQVRHYDLDLRYAISSNRLDGRARIRVVPGEELRRLSLDLVGLRASKVAVGGSAARWTERSGKLHITPATPLAAGVEVEIEVRYGGKPGPVSTPWGLLGWEELTDGVLVAAQPTGASTWFPCNDLASQKAPARIAVTVASSYRAVANGQLLERTPHGSTTTWVYEQVEPTSPYLLTVQVGRYDEHVLAEVPVPVRVVVAAEHRAAAEAALARQAEMLEVFADCFGPYPFAAGYTVVVCDEPLEIPLEAQGLSIFGTNHLEGEERLIAHELAHQWFGNSLTAARWRDIWLHEGFACYAEWLWSERSGSQAAEAHAREHHGRLASCPQDLVLIDPGPDDMFDDRVYKRGALALHALRTVLGCSTFFGLLREWVAAGNHRVVTTEAFEAMAEAKAGRPLDELFDAWLRQPGLPPLS